MVESSCICLYSPPSVYCPPPPFPKPPLPMPPTPPLLPPLLRTSQPHHIPPPTLVLLLCCSVIATHSYATDNNTHTWLRAGMRGLKKRGLHQNGGVGGHHSIVFGDHTSPNLDHNVVPTVWPMQRPFFLQISEKNLIYLSRKNLSSDKTY